MSEVSDPARSVPGVDELTDTERDVLDFAGLTWKYAGAREQAIRDRFGWSVARYSQVLLGLLDRPAALAYAPMTVRRWQRLRARWRSARRTA